MPQSLTTAVVLADRSGHELNPLFNDSCPALLPIVGKTLLEYCLDDLATAGIKKAVIIISSCTQEIQDIIGHGDAWGIEVEYVLSRGEEPAEKLLPRFSTLVEERFLAIRGDVLRSASLQEIIRQSEDDVATFQATFDTRYAGIAIANRQSPQLATLNWPPSEALAPDARDYSGCSVNHLLNLEDYRSANLSALNGEIKGLVLQGLEARQDVRIGRLSHFPANAVIDTPVYLGDHSSVHQSCGIYGPVVIGSNCFIDRDTQISASVVLPGTYIGAGLDIKDSIVGDGMLINTLQDITVQIDDPSWVAPMEQRSIASDVSRIEQLFVFLILICSLPLWPLAALLSLSSSPPGLIRETILSNKRGIRGQRLTSRFYYWATEVPMLRYMPGLFSVASGHIRMFGMSSTINNKEMTSELPSLRQAKVEQPPAGLISPALLYLADTAPPEEVELFEICYAAERNLLSELKCWARLVLKLFTVSAWRQKENRQ